MSARDWNAVKLIYEESVGEGTGLETDAPSQWSTWDSEHSPSCRLVARVHDQVAGWAALKPTSRQRAYRGVMDVGIYVARRSRGQGLGKALLLALIGASERAGVWTLQAGIFPDNVPSVALHEGCGFRLWVTASELPR
jgi:phosphinothricin acetyltransferase